MVFENNTITSCNSYGITVPVLYFHLPNANNAIENSKGLRLETAVIAGTAT
jgi:hypothetical protein